MKNTNTNQTETEEIVKTEIIVFTMKTHRESMYLQMLGRGLRRSNEKSHIEVEPLESFNRNDIHTIGSRNPKSTIISDYLLENSTPVMDVAKTENYLTICKRLKELKDATTD